MRKVITAAALCFALAACTAEERAANEARARAVLSQINAGIRVAAVEIKNAVDFACANQASVASTALVTRGILLQQTGPNTIQNIDNLDRALVAYNQACAAAASATTPSATILRTAIVAYQNVKAAGG